MVRSHSGLRFSLYDADAPTAVHTLSPEYGPPRGGTAVTVRGADFRCPPSSSSSPSRRRPRRRPDRRCPEPSSSNPRAIQQYSHHPRAPSQSKTLFVTVEPDASDDWRLDEIADVIRGGGVGIIPTDTKYAFVADLESRDAVQVGRARVLFVPFDRVFSPLFTPLSAFARRSTSRF